MGVWYRGAVLALLMLSRLESPALAVLETKRVQSIEEIVKGQGSIQKKIALLLGDDTDEAHTKRVLAELRATLELWQKTPPADAVEKANLDELAEIISVLADPTPDKFPPGKMGDYYCFLNNNNGKSKGRNGRDSADEALMNPKCNSRIDGYAYAAYWLSRFDKCWYILQGIGTNKSKVFRTSVREYFEVHQEKDMCIKPAEPPRCQKPAYCWGPDQTIGVAFRPAVEFAAGAGKGLGFDESNNVGFTLSASLGARVFFLSDKIDIRLGLGVAAIPSASGDTSTDMMTGDKKSRSAFLLAPGFGFFNGLFGISAIFLFDPSGDDKTGKGLALTLDVVAIKNLTDNK
jgi:hypothetical protein